MQQMTERQRVGDETSGMHRHRPEQNHEEYHEPQADREPRDFNDSLDHMDF